MKSILSILLLCISFNSFAQDTVKTPKTKLLKEVNIKGRQPLIQQKTDRTLITVNDQVLKIAESALDVIRLAPGLIISDNEDAILISGKDAVQVMINDKLVKLTSRDLIKFLKTIPATSLNQLEVMNNPSAKYDVKGNTALINIKTRQTTTKGITGSVNLESSQGIHNIGDISNSLNYGTNQFAVSSYLAYHYGTYASAYEKRRTLSDGLLYQQNTSTDQWRDPVIRITGDYFINSKQTISGLIERERSKNISSNLTSSFLDQRNSNDLSYPTYGYNPNVSTWKTYNLNYRFADTLDTEFSFNFDRSDNQKDDHNSISNNFYHTKTDIGITTIKGDYAHKWTNDIKLEAGFKLSTVSTNNSLSAFTLLNEISKIDSNQSNRFLYNEKINSIYTNVGKTYKKWGIQLGLRIEHSHINGISTSTSGVETRKPDSTYYNLMPAIYLSYSPSALHSFSLSLTERISRPDYRALQPFSYQVDAFDYKVGNPGLRVQKNKNAELAYTYNSRITLTASYTQTTDLFNMVMYTSGDIILETTQNTGKMENWNFNLNYPVKLSSWWNMLNKINGFYNHFNGQLYQGTLNEGKWSSLISTSQRFTLPGKLLLQVSARYNAAIQNLIYSQKSNGNVSISISKKIFQEQGSFRAGMNDIFKTQRNYTVVDFGDLRYDQNNTWESRRLSVEFSWRFGNKKIKQTKDRSTGNTEEKRRSGS